MANQASLPLPGEVLTASQPRKGSLTYAAPVGVSLLVTAVLYASRKNDISVLDVGLSFLLVFFTCMIYRAWTENNKTDSSWSSAPLLLTLALAYAQAFAAGVFWAARQVGNVDHGAYEVTHESCTIALMLAVVSLGALYYGMQLRISDTLCLRTLPYLKEERGTWIYCRVVLALGIATAYTADAASGMEGMRQIFLSAVYYVPLVAFCLIFRRYLEGEASSADKLLLLLFTANKVLSGIASGWLGNAVAFLLVAITVYISTRKRLPVTALLVVLAYVIFMQPGKMKFREEFWYGRRSASPIERVMFWIQASTEAWGDVINNTNSNTSAADLLSNTTDRTSLVAATAQVVEFVPTMIPYQNGSTYAFLLVSWVPRALWPNKPSANEVNYLYQVSFRLTRQDNLDSVSLAPGIIGEAYWNFGWAGVVIMSMFLGIFLRYLEMQCARRRSGMFLNALLVITIPQFLGVESHMGTYLGGLPLEVLVILGAFVPVLTIRSRPTATAATGATPNGTVELAPQPEA